MILINRCELWHNNWLLIHSDILCIFSENIFDVAKLVLTLFISEFLVTRVSSQVPTVFKTQVYLQKRKIFPH